MFTSPKWQRLTVYLEFSDQTPNEGILYCLHHRNLNLFIHHSTDTHLCAVSGVWKRWPLNLKMRTSESFNIHVKVDDRFFDFLYCLKAVLIAVTVPKFLLKSFTLLLKRKCHENARCQEAHFTGSSKQTPLVQALWRPHDFTAGIVLWGVSKDTVQPGLHPVKQTEGHFLCLGGSGPSNYLSLDTDWLPWANMPSFSMLLIYRQEQYFLSPSFSLTW